MVEFPHTEKDRRDALLEVQNITFGYDNKPLLYEVSLQVRKGEMVGLLGPNGSGKTTLLRLISGLLAPQRGAVVVEGRTLQAWGRRRAAQRIAVVPQELHIPFAFTVEHMVSLGRTPFVKPFFGTRTPHDQRVIADALELAGIGPFAERIFNELSGGERQRVMIAMALAQKPSLLLLDEPTSHLDIKYQIETLELVQHLNKEREVTIIAAMHDLNLASRYFSRLLLFQRGIVADGSPAEVLEPAVLSRVYDINVRVGILRGAKHLSVLPPDEERDDTPHRQQQAYVHLLSGGGSGEVMMRALADEHIPFISGALNIGDSDYTLALRLAEQVIVEQPYAPISQASLEQVRASLERVALLIICPTPIGAGNVALLREAVSAAQRGLSVLLVATPDTRDVGGAVETDDGLLERTGMAARDYTGGEGVQLAGELLQHGAIVVRSVGEAIEQIKQHYRVARRK